MVCKECRRGLYKIGAVGELNVGGEDSTKWLVILTLAASIAGCSIIQTSKVDETVTSAKLAATKKAVALVRIGSASPQCTNVAVLIGKREGEGYRRHQSIMVANERSLIEAPIAEVELDAGQYHIIGYSCHTDHGPKMIVESAGGTLYRKSYAHFQLAAGEIVNVGFLHFGASHEGRSLFGRPVRTDVEVSEWPLAEIERFKLKRPTIYAQMITRLMTVGDTAAEAEPACETWAKLKIERKIQDLPPECGGVAAQKKRSSSAR
jgi:hypothetical protein